MPMSKQIGILNSSEPFESLCGILTGCITINFYFGIEPKQFAVKTAVSPILIAAHRFFENLFHIIWICFPAKVTGGSFPARLSFYTRNLQGSFLFVGFLFLFNFYSCPKIENFFTCARTRGRCSSRYIYLFYGISSEEMGYNCTFIAISSEEIPFSSEEILRSGHEKSDILSNIASKQISKIAPFSGWGSLDT